MTVNEIIARFDEDRNNTERFENKLFWVKELETMVLFDVILTHKNTVDSPETYFDEWGATSDLLIPIPYTDVYIHYMDMKMQLKLNQLKKYNNASTLFNNAFITYQQWYNRNNTPLGKKGWLSHDIL